MPGLIFSSRYHKLDDTVYLLCQNCGHSVNKTEERKTKMKSSSSGSGGSSKNLFHWSATLANHKFQKLSKNLVSSVTKFCTLPSSISNCPNSQDPTCVRNNNNEEGEEKGHFHKHKTELENIEHLLVNNVNVALVHNLKSARRRTKVDLEAELQKLNSSSTRSLDEDFLELMPMRKEDDGSLSGASTAPITSPHWSRASSMTNSFDSTGANSPEHRFDFSIENNGAINTSTAKIKSLIQNNNNLSLRVVGSLRKLGSLKARNIDRCPNILDSKLNIVSPSSSPQNITPSKHIENQNNREEEEEFRTMLRNRIYEEDPELKNAPWFQAGIPREITLEVLRHEPIGSFIVRESSTKAGCYALSVRVPSEFQINGIAHYLILQTGLGGYKIKGFTKEFGSLTSLITHHSVMAELLPCPLHLFKKSKVTRLNSSDFMEPEQLLTISSTHKKYTDF